MSDKEHSIPLWGLFMALLVLTAAEVGLYETWSRVPAFQEVMPKYAMVLTILIFTLPKAAIVLVYFMHLKFEKQFIVWLALIPAVFAAIAVFPPLADALALKDRAFNEAQYMDRSHGHGDDGHDHKDGDDHKDEKPAAPDPNDPFS